MFSRIDVLLDKPDVQRYITLAETGKLYEEFILQYQIKYAGIKTRDEIKRELFSVLFSKNHNANKSKALFTELFPHVDGLFRYIKHHEHELLSLLLQRIESDLVIEDICRLMTAQYPKVPLFTIHDSITTTVDHISLLQNIMEERFKERLGTVPKLKIEAWKIDELEITINKLKAKIPDTLISNHGIAA